MADDQTPRNPVIFVTDVGAPEGSVYVHDQATGTTVQAPATTDGYLNAIRDLNNR